MSKFWRSRLRVYLICLVLLTILPFSIVIIYNTIEARRLAIAAFKKDLSKLTQLTANMEERVVEEAHQFLEAISTNPAVLNSNTTICNNYLAGLLKRHPSYWNIAVAELNGNIICSAIPLNTPINVYDRKYFQDTIKTDDFVMSEYILSRLNEMPTIAFSHPIPVTGEIQRVLITGIKLDWLNSLLAKVPLHPGASVAVIDTKGVIIASYPEPQKWAGRSLPTPLFAKDLPSKNLEFTEGKWLDGVMRLSIYIPFETRGRNRACVVIGIPKNVLFAATDQAFHKNMIVLGIATLIALIATGLIGETFILRPIHILLDTTKQLAQGNLSTRTGMQYKDKNEFGQLARAFDIMAEHIEQRTDALEATTRELEATVKEHAAVNEHLRTAIQAQAKTEEALRKSEEQFRQAQKMEAIGRLAGGIAHDFNNILTVIIGHTELLQNGINTKDLLKESLNEIYNASQRATVLVRQLLAFSRKQVLEPKIVSLNEIINGIKSMLKRTIGETITLNITLASNISSIKTDPGQIEQVILNLVVNARDAMPDGGYLTIETTNITLGKEYTANRFDIKSGEYVMLAVSDTGCGMDKETLSHIYEPFFTTKEKGKGTGLGLPTVYGIVKQSNGHIFVYSEPTHGTTFKIYFPQVNENPQAEKISQKTAPFTHRIETVLIVEDEEGVRSLIREILHQHGYTVLQASNSEEAIKLATLYDKEIHLLLTDVIIPGISGRQTANQITNLRPNIKVLYMSGYTDNAVVHQGFLEPGISFIQKPFTTRTLTTKIREILDSQTIL